METGFTKWIIVVTVVLCVLLELIDTSIVNVALTQMMGNLSATQQEVTWVVAAYGIANVIVIPMTGFLAEQFGRKNYFFFSVVLFTLASMACGQSTNLWELVAFRFIQGIGGGALMATSQAILHAYYVLAKEPDPDDPLADQQIRSADAPTPPAAPESMAAPIGKLI